MVERVARATAEAFMKTDMVERLSRGDALDPDLLQIYFGKVARAAIEAMREPTAEMLEAANAIPANQRYSDGYRAMIDAALSPHTT